MDPNLGSTAENATHTTELEFYMGISENVETVGTGYDAYMRLKLTEDGSYASGFDFDGVYKFNPSTGSDYARSLAIDTQYVYIAGEDRAPGNYQWRIEKRNKISGELVTEFDTDGIVESNPSTGSDSAYSIAVDCDYIYIAGYDYSGGDYQWRVEKRNKHTGMLVSAFDSDGIINSDPSTSSDYAYTLSIDQKYIYIAGQDNSPGNPQIRVEKRDKTTGALVASFGTSGVVTSNPSSSTDSTRSITVDSNYLYIAANDYSLGNNQWRIEKRDKITGALITAFDSDGVVLSNPSVNADYTQSITVDSDYIYVAGSDYSPGNYQWHIEKRDKTTGALVTAFDTDGILVNNPSTGFDSAFSIDVDSENIYVTGYDNTQTNYQWRIEKRDKTTGALVTDFDTDGVVESNPSASTDYPYYIVVDSDDLFIAGFDRIHGNYQWRVEKRDKTSGELAIGFNNTGKVMSNPGPNSDEAEAMAIDSDYIYIGGNSYASGNYQMRLEKRYKTTGELVTTFDTDGVVETNPSSGTDTINDIALDENYLYTAGYDSTNTNWQMRVEKRDKTTGALVTAFDTDGIVESNPSSGHDSANAIAVDEDYIYIAGYDRAMGGMDQQWRIEKRNKTNGALVTAFDTDGIVLNNPSNSYDNIFSIEVDSDFIYIAGADLSPGDAQWRIEKRDKTAGYLITTFDTDGIIQVNPSSNSDYLYSMTLDENYIYLTGFDDSTNDAQWRIEKRDKNSGALVTDFDSDGIVLSNPSTRDEYPYSIEVDRNYIYIGGYDANLINHQWRLEKRDIITGMLIETFSQDGVIQNNPSSDHDVINSIAVDSSYVYAAGFDEVPGDMEWRIEKFKNNVYPEEGVFTSQNIELSDTDNVFWSSISWHSNVLPSLTMVKFQIAACEDANTWEYLGPDGTEDTYYETAAGQPIWSGLSGRYLRYKAYFSTADESYTPTLSDVTVTFVEIELPSIDLYSPNGGEDWMKQKFYPITWDAAGLLGDNPVDIYYSIDNGDNWTIIAMNEPNDGLYNWTVPNQETPNAFIKVVVTDIYDNTISDTSDASFAIDPPPPDAADVPTGGGSQFPPDDGTDTGSSTDDKSKVQTDDSDWPWLMPISLALLVIVIISVGVNLYLIKSRRSPKIKQLRNNEKQIARIDELLKNKRR
jgi:hypothetical protein